MNEGCCGEQYQQMIDNKRFTNKNDMQHVTVCTCIQRCTLSSCRHTVARNSNSRKSTICFDCTLCPEKERTVIFTYL